MKIIEKKIEKNNKKKETKMNKNVMKEIRMKKVKTEY